MMTPISGPSTTNSAHSSITTTTTTPSPTTIVPPQDTIFAPASIRSNTYRTHSGTCISTAATPVKLSPLQTNQWRVEKSKPVVPSVTRLLRLPAR